MDGFGKSKSGQPSRAVNSAINSLLQAANKTSGRQFITNVVGQKEKARKSSSSSESSEISEEQPGQVSSSSESEDVPSPKTKLAEKESKLSPLKEKKIAVDKSPVKKKDTKLVDTTDNRPKHHEVSSSESEEPSEPIKKKHSVKRTKHSDRNDSQKHQEMSISESEEPKHVSRQQPIKQNQSSLKNAIANKDVALFLLKLPNDVDPRTLLNQSIDLNQGSKLHLSNGKKLQVTREEGISSSCQMLTPVLFHVGHIDGVLHAKHYIKKKKIVTPEIIERNFDVKLETKERHPIFGSGYDDEVHLGESVMERLKHPEKIKRKKQKKQKIESPTESIVNDVSCLVESPTTNKKKKKHQQSVSNSFTDVESDKQEDTEMHERKNKKKKKHEAKEESNQASEIEHEAEGWEVKKKKKKKKQEADEEILEKKKKKSKKDRRSSGDDIDIFKIIAETKQKVLGND